MENEHQHIEQSKTPMKHIQSDEHSIHGKGKTDENPSHGHMGQDHHRMMIDDFKKRFWISILITIPVLVISPMVQEFLGFNLVFPGNLIVLFLLMICFGDTISY